MIIYARYPAYIIIHIFTQTGIGAAANAVYIFADDVPAAITAMAAMAAMAANLTGLPILFYLFYFSILPVFSVLVYSFILTG